MVDRDPFCRMLQDKDEDWIREKLEGEEWGERRKQMARSHLREREREAAEKSHLRKGGPFWVTRGLLAATVAVVAFAWVALSGPPLF